MTEGYPSHTAAGSGTHGEHDTTAMPRVPTSDTGGWSATQHSSGRSASSHAADDTSGGPLGGVGAKLASAGAAAVSVASSAASTAKDAMKGAAADAEKRSRPVGSNPRGRQPRKARLTLSHINVYSVFKFACVLAIALFFVWLIMVGVLYGLLDVAGVLNKVNDAVRTISGNDAQKNVVTGSVVFGTSIIIGAVNIILFIAMATIGAMIYNLCADLVGGAEVTLSERE